MTLGPHQRPQFDGRDFDLLKRAGASPSEFRASPTDCPQDGELDLATARIYHRLLQRSENRSFLHTVLAGPPIPARESVLFGLVPGAFYREHRGTGADGKRVLDLLRELGFPAEVIPIQSFGRLEENGALICNWLRRQQTRRVVLVALSKGAADCKFALRAGGPEWDRVAAWINLSGLVQGTPLIAWLRRHPLRMAGVRLLLWSRGQSFAAADDLRHGEAAPLMPWPELPRTLRLVHVVAFPSRRHLRHRWAFRAYERLAPLGPNDGGGILLQDTLRWPGIVCPVWGVDHYLEPAWDATPFLRNVVLAALGPPAEPCHARASAANPIAAPASTSTT